MSKMLNILREARRPVALTGAGISAPSGIPTFQSQWKGRPIRDFLGREYFERDPAGFFELYCAMEAWGKAEPNAAHLALAEYRVPVITQNIDGLHQKAGSERVIELHGNLRRLVCRACGRVLDVPAFCAALRPLYAAGDLEAAGKRLLCACGAPLDVDVVLYGDPVRGMEESQALARGCDLLLVIGTALETYPANTLPELAARHGARVMIENEDCIAALTE